MCACRQPWKSSGEISSDPRVLAAARQVEGQLREAWSQKQEALREAMQDRRKLDRLAERMRQQRQLVQHRIDQLEMDEAARRTSVM